MSMAAGEYVSVSSQSDTENADIARERLELETDDEHELLELTNIYITRGLTPELAHQVAVQFTERDALTAHARDELGITEALNARPIQAALASAATFATGAALPLLVVLLAPVALTVPYVATMSLLFLASLGALAAKAGGAKIWVGMVRVAFWGVLAMAATAGVGSLFGVVAA
jgi:VIT1/CCC1 family predicted Fe2+/Mn2+ transporter